MVVAVTVLTSLNDTALTEVGIARPIVQQVAAMAKLAADCGIAGVVCSPQEIQLVRQAAGPNFKIVTPGIRMPGQTSNDQQRLATPREALAAGADYIVVGRAVTAASDPRSALDALVESTK
jgi:orotidine-5'-phosphate decarboxylase